MLGVLQLQFSCKRLTLYRLWCTWHILDNICEINWFLIWFSKNTFLSFFRASCFSRSEVSWFFNWRNEVIRLLFTYEWWFTNCSPMDKGWYFFTSRFVCYWNALPIFLKFGFYGYSRSPCWRIYMHCFKHSCYGNINSYNDSKRYVLVLVYFSDRNVFPLIKWVHIL